jgi:uncharacterized protein
MSHPAGTLLLAAVIGWGTWSASAAATQKPSFDCERASGSVEEMICSDSTLAEMDVRMHGIWQAVLELSAPDSLWVRAEQRGWIKGRNECWKSDDVRECIVASYKIRIAELQARWALVPSKGPFRLVCNDNPTGEVVATLFETDPPSGVLERGDQVVVVFLGPSASGARYEGSNVSFWMRGDEAFVTWGWNAEEMRCRIR